MTIWELNCLCGFSCFKTKEEAEAYLKPEGFAKKRPLASLAILAAFGYTVVMLTLRFL